MCDPTCYVYCPQYPLTKYLLEFIKANKVVAMFRYVGFQERPLYKTTKRFNAICETCQMTFKLLSNSGLKLRLEFMKSYVLNAASSFISPMSSIKYLNVVESLTAAS